MRRYDLNIVRDRAAQELLRDVPAQRVVTPKRVAEADDQKANHVYVDRWYGTAIPDKCQSTNHRITNWRRHLIPIILNY